MRIKGGARIIRYRLAALLMLLMGWFVLPVATTVPHGLAAAPEAGEALWAYEYADERDEVFFSFRFRGVGDVVVIGMHQDGQIYLPLTELFELLGIFYEADVHALRVTGHYLDTQRRYEIHFNNYTARFEGRSYSYDADAMFVDELDFYVLPELLEQIFGLEFTVDVSALVIRLQTTDTMPVVERMERAQRRQRIELGMRERMVHPKEFERNRRFVGGGFLDYSFTGNLTDQQQSYNYTGSIGAEFLGGDVQGNLFGSWSQQASNFSTSGLRWRYVFQDATWLTQVRVGQYRTEGPQSRSYQGVHLTNQPIEPRRTLDEFSFQGSAPPESEVEMFINNRLVDYRIVDEMGIYQFSIPLSYGSSNVRLMIYEPDGQVREVDRRIQVPFTFLPPGEVNYHLSAGRMDTPVFGTQDYSDLATASLTWGVANWLTARVGGEYLSEVHAGQAPFVYGGLSARVLGQYLVNFDVAPQAWYRMQASVVYANSVSWTVNSTYYTTQDGLYNLGRNIYEASANLFLPITIGEMPFNLRLSGDRREFDGGSSNRMGGDLGLRLGRVNVRAGYRDVWRYAGAERISSDGRLVGTFTYTTPRARTFPRLIRGTYLRAQLDYSMRFEQVERVDVQLARSLFRAGRLRVSYGHNFMRSFNTLEAGLTFDFNRTRSTTTTRTTGSNYMVRQNIRGSVGYDDYHRRIVMDNRQQVGRSAASVRLFVDRNNSGRFDEGDELIRASAVRMDRSGNARLHSDGVIRVTQIQQYYQNNMVINVGQIPNPLLVPVIREFSFVADPNRFKPMDIPFYTSGILDGMVLRQRGDEQRGLGGVRVMLRQVDGDFSETLRTFSDGSYYAMEIPPGRYEAWVDSTQQAFLGAVSLPAVRRFEVRALAEGDFLEDLNFVLFDSDAIEPEEPDPDEQEREIERLVAERANQAIRFYVAAQQAFYELEFTDAMALVERSLEIYETDYGLALKGSLHFVLGEPSVARDYWLRAAQRNPDIAIPDTEVLEQMIRREALELSLGAADRQGSGPDGEGQAQDNNEAGEQPTQTETFDEQE